MRKLFILCSVVLATFLGAIGGAVIYAPGIAQAVFVDFTDGFESGTTNNWPEQSIDSGASITATTGAAKTGTYGLRIESDSSETTYIQYAFTGRDQVHAGADFRWDTEGVSGNNGAGIRILDSAGTRIGDIYRQNQTGGLWLRTRLPNGAFRYDNTGSTVSLDTWVKFEIDINYNGGSVSQVQVEVNDVVKINQSNFSLGGTGVFTKARLGAEHKQHVYADVDNFFGPGEDNTIEGC